IAGALNRLWRRRGRVFGDRYHAHDLKTPREVRHALCYVLQNARKHAAQARVFMPTNWIDPYSSARAFDGWRRRPSPPSAQEERPPVHAPTAWLLREGWRLHNLIAF